MSNVLRLATASVPWICYYQDLIKEDYNPEFLKNSSLKKKATEKMKRSFFVPLMTYGLLYAHVFRSLVTTVFQFFIKYLVDDEKVEVPSMH